MFHAARNLQGEGVDVAVVRIELVKNEAGRRGRGWINGGQANLRFGLEKGEGLKKKLSMFQKPLIPVSALRDDLVSFVQGEAAVRQ